MLLNVDNIFRFLRILDNILRIKNLSYREAIIYSFTIILTLLFITLFLSIKQKTITFRKNTNYYSKRKLILLFTTILILLTIEMLSKIIVFGVDISEHTPDTLLIFQEGYWRVSLKNAYYDFINVPAVIRVVLGLIVGILVPHSIDVASLFSFTIGLELILVYYLVVRKAFKKTSYALYYILAMLALFSNPYSSFVSNYLGLSFCLSILSLYLLFILKYKPRCNLLITAMILYLSATLTHGIAMLMMIPLFLLYIAIRRIRCDTNLNRYLLLFVLIALVVDISRFLYTGAYRGAGTYIHEILNFFFGKISYLRGTRWSSPVIPRVTAFAFSALPALAVTLPLTSAFLKTLAFLGIIQKNITNMCNRIVEEYGYTIYNVFLYSSLVFLLAAFASSFFSNSLSREFGYPGVMLLIVPAAYTICLFHGVGGKRTIITLSILLIATALLGFMTPSKIPWYNEYRGLTVHWRSAFLNNYLYVIYILKYYAKPCLHILVYSYDKVPLSYAFLIQHKAILPEGSLTNIIVYASTAFKYYSVNYTDIIYVANHCIFSTGTALNY